MNARTIIEISPNEPRASACLANGAEISTDNDVAEAFADCCTSGDCEEACRFVRDQIGVDWRIIARNAAGEYENREATAEEKEATARAIYFESERDFSDIEWAEIYLIWEAANSL
jgi:predicted 3-demethylubiquinone-9 3-methyltransferase (glyoxalase superfamily)